MTLSEFTSEDYLKLKWHFVFLVLCLMIVGGVFFGISQIDSDATRQLNIARADMNTAQTQVDQIEQEESAIVENLDNFRNMEAAGLINPKDPIDMMEKGLQIRTRFDLFPIGMVRTALEDFTLPYDTSVYEAGEPVLLETTSVDFTLPLLHEDDLANFMDAIMSGPELVLPTTCQVSGRSNNNYLVVRRHLNATCSFMWYTFAVLDEDGGRL